MGPLWLRNPLDDFQHTTIVTTRINHLCFVDRHSWTPHTFQDGQINPLVLRYPGNRIHCWKKRKGGINGPGIPLILIQPLMVDDWFGVCVCQALYQRVLHLLWLTSTNLFLAAFFHKLLIPLCLLIHSTGHKDLW